MSDTVLPYPVAVQPGAARARMSCDGRRVPAALVESSNGHAVVEVDAHHPLFDTGSAVTLALGTSPPFTVRATLTRRMLSRRVRRYELTLHDVEGIVEAWHALFNRRDAVRVGTRTGEFVDVLLHVDPERPSAAVYAATLVDLSESGMQVQLEPGEPLPGPRTLTARLRLPRASRPIGMVCQVRWQRTDRRLGHRLGLCFDRRTPWFWRQQQLVLDYVHKREQEERRRPATPEAAVTLGLPSDALRPIAQSVQLNRRPDPERR